MDDKIRLADAHLFEEQIVAIAETGVLFKTASHLNDGTVLCFNN